MTDAEVVAVHRKQQEMVESMRKDGQPGTPVAMDALTDAEAAPNDQLAEILADLRNPYESAKKWVKQQ